MFSECPLSQALQAPSSLPWALPLGAPEAIWASQGPSRSQVLGSGDPARRWTVPATGQIRVGMWSGS